MKINSELAYRTTENMWGEFVSRKRAGKIEWEKSEITGSMKDERMQEKSEKVMEH